ncbi:hypothetical protein [Nostoc sp. ChiVER01]|uniref:hypothetical protein n=1 Tax=Nostoc sp. ChiVER01 TaxID=3075382 RepID=UPI002AD2FDF2|nr:hypothetical protein [Nostoc sp. ChiVER01]MDZ8228310.1 hypothetical protein [Nostoc sp. ChiVER01]
MVQNLVMRGVKSQPEGDSNLSTRLRLIKTFVTKQYGKQLGINADISHSRHKRKERNL